MDWQFPKRLPRGLRDAWVGFGADDGWLEVDAKHGWLRIGPLTIYVGVNWQDDWRPLPVHLRKRRLREWEEWVRAIHKGDTEDQIMRRAKMLAEQ